MWPAHCSLFRCKNIGSAMSSIEFLDLLIVEAWVSTRKWYKQVVLSVLWLRSLLPFRGLWTYLHKMLNSLLELFCVVLHHLSCLALAYMRLVHHFWSRCQTAWSSLPWFIPTFNVAAKYDLSK
jgi:hypothetical protein